MSKEFDLMSKVFEPVSNELMLDFVKSIEAERASMDFTIPLFKYLKEVIEKEANVRILIKQPDSLLDAEL